ncbi:uncharacterized protein LOC135374674 [Ornithodoros turicata]|uniref:uncharacterized protein LOC135374674 n=1 Tax=Ornithodoros turicata TaxID=34597 RepID=UPI003138D0B9
MQRPGMTRNSRDQPGSRHGTVMDETFHSAQERCNTSSGRSTPRDSQARTPSAIPGPTDSSPFTHFSDQDNSPDELLPYVTDPPRFEDSQQEPRYGNYPYGSSATSSVASRPEGRAMPDYEFQKQVLKNQNLLRMVQQQLVDLVSSLAPVRQSLSETPQLLSSPFHTVSDLEKFESELTPEQEKQAVRELTSLGGSSVRSAVRRILSHTFTNELAQQYSWEGRKGKLKFVELK